MSNKSKTFCILPHTTLAIQNYGDVCACNVNKYSYKLNDTLYTVDQGPIEPIWDSPTRHELIRALDNGVQHESCKSCWDLESIGKRSVRQNFNVNLSHLEPNQKNPKVLILKPGNTCNAACRICNPATSSSWYQDDFKRKQLKNPALKFNEYVKEFESVRNSFHPDNPNFWPGVQKWLENIELIDIYGGEPMLIDGLWTTLKGAVDQGYSKNINLQLHTNLGTYRPDYLEILSQFKSVNIGMSIDSHIPEHFEYMRHKLSYEKCINTAHKLLEWSKTSTNMNVSVTCSVSVLNVWNLDEIVKNLKQELRRTIGLNFVTVPDRYYDIRHLPRVIKQRLIDKYKSISDLDTVVNFLRQTQPGCVIQWPKFCLETDKLDQIRNQNFKAVMPEWYAQLEPYWDYKKSHPEWFK